LARSQHALEDAMLAHQIFRSRHFLLFLLGGAQHAHASKRSAPDENAALEENASRAHQ
jgi:hypothetical protein